MESSFGPCLRRDVRLPGKDVGSPEVFPFGTPYLEIYDTLKGKDEEFFRRNNLLGLVARNATIKTAPERFQDISGPAVANFDVVLCFDSRVFYLVVEGTLVASWRHTHCCIREMFHHIHIFRASRVSTCCGKPNACASTCCPWHTTRQDVSFSQPRRVVNGTPHVGVGPR